MREQLGVALYQQIPIFVVVTKIDCCRPAVLEKNITHLEHVLKSPGSKKIPLMVRDESDAVDAASKMSDDR